MSVLSTTFNSIISLVPAWRRAPITRATARQASTRECGAEAADPVAVQRRVPAYRHLAEHLGLARIEQRSDEPHDW